MFKKQFKSTSGLIALVTGIAMMGTAFSVSLAEDSKRESAIKPKKKIELFDGKSFEKFYSYMKDTQYEDPRKIFQVTDGMLHISGDGFGSLVSKKEYRDYHCVLEYKWGPRTWQTRKDRTKDSGMLVHSQGPDGGYNNTWMHSIEVQIIEGGVGDFLLVAGKDKDGTPLPMSMTCEVDRDRDGEVIWKKGGEKEVFNLENRRRINWYGRDPDWKDVLGFRGKDDVESPGEQWTRIDTICDGGHISVYVNGVQVNEAFDALPDYGRLQIQTELAELFVRRWELYPVGKGPKPAKAKQD